MTTRKPNKKSKLSDYESSNDRVLSFSKNEDIDFFNTQISTFTNGVKLSDTEANSTDRSLASQLILITTVLITANIVIFSNAELLETLTWEQEELSIIGSGSLMLSLMCGIAYYEATKKFHIDWSDARDYIVKSIASGAIITRAQLNKLIDEKTENLSSHIEYHYLKLQIIFLAFALLAFLALTTSLLLKV